MSTNNSRRTKAHQIETARRQKERALANRNAMITGAIYMVIAVAVGYIDPVFTGWMFLNLLATMLVAGIGKASSRPWGRAFCYGLFFSWIIGLIVILLGKKDTPASAFVPDEEALADPIEAWEKEQAVKAGPPPAPSGWKDRLAE